MKIITTNCHLLLTNNSSRLLRVVKYVSGISHGAKYYKYTFGAFCLYGVSFPILLRIPPSFPTCHYFCFLYSLLHFFFKSIAATY
jgi:hypothetical protein